MNIYHPNILWLLAFSFSLLAACDKHQNPFDDIKKPEEQEENPIELDPNSIEGLHANIFSKTCANSGCHDGTFEPDFRTIEGTYNTLVYHPVIKNDAKGTFKYRVLPGQPDQSQLVARLTYDIDNNSGIMPLVIEPNSDWPAKKEAYIQNVKKWIQDGAKDFLGNSPSLGSDLPQMRGAAARMGSDWLSHDGAGKSYLRVPADAASIDLFVALQDDQTAAPALSGRKIRFSKSAEVFTDAEEMELSVLQSPVRTTGYFDQPEDYYHKVTLKPSDLGKKGDIIYFRVYVRDDDNPETEIPSAGSARYIKNYFALLLADI